MIFRVSSRDSGDFCYNRYITLYWLFKQVELVEGSTRVFVLEEIVMNEDMEGDEPGHGPDHADNPGQEERPDTGILLKTRPKTKKPSLYKVLLLNDDYTPMEFVVHVVERFFNKNRQEATDVMLHVHRRGVGVCGVFTFEVAETKVAQVMDFARANEQPLQCTMEKE
jgi:ATP-dependent Clp protease adaptor protein ClpS